ncbi:hypothetical protein H1Z24_001501 [Salmonella enterica]|nr:hypothetical protein [Salmonella enterica]
MEKISYEAFMSLGAKQKIEQGEWRVIGVTVQDARSGKIVVGFKTATTGSPSGYTPSLFVALRNEIFIAQRLTSEVIRHQLRQQTVLSRIEGKLDHLADL